MPRKIIKKAAYGSGSVVRVRPGIWRVRVRAEGSQICRTVKGSEAQAVRLKNEILKDLSSGAYIAPAPLTFREHLEEWIENVAKAKAPGTYMLYRRTADKWIIPILGHHRIQRLKPSDIREFFNAIPQEFSKAYKQKMYLIIYGALKAAQSEGLVKDNAASKMAGKPNVDKSALEAGAISNCWNEQEVQRFLAVARSYGPRQAAFYTLALDTGMRKGELAALEWPDIDFQRATVRIKGSLSFAMGEAEIGPVKNRQARRLNVSAETLECLKRLSLMQAKCDAPSKLVFRRADGGPLRINNLGNREFDDLIRLARVKRITLHGLRHTCATLLLAAGVPVNYVSERLGHQDPAITLRIYAHAIPSGQAMLMDKLRSALGFTAEAKAPPEGWKN